MSDIQPVIIDFPLRGDNWVAYNSPGDRVPSHGTDMLGQRYAFDFLRVDDRRKLRTSPGSTLRLSVVGTAARDCYAWDATIFAPFDAEVVAVRDGISEPVWIHPVREILRMIRNAVTFRESKLPMILGNHVILRRADGIFAGFAHLRPGSVAVAVGQSVRTGDVLGRVGHTGNSTNPHLHFQLMDTDDLMKAQGIPVAFRAYEVRAGDTWRPVSEGVPRRSERIRYENGSRQPTGD